MWNFVLVALHPCVQQFDGFMNFDLHVLHYGFCFNFKGLSLFKYVKILTEYAKQEESLNCSAFKKARSAQYWTTCKHMYLLHHAGVNCMYALQWTIYSYSLTSYAVLVMCTVLKYTCVHHLSLQNKHLFNYV